MSQTPTPSSPAEPLTVHPSRTSFPAVGEASIAVQQMAQRLRAELAESVDRERQARLLMEVANLEERSGDEPGAARDYLASYNAHQSFREPLEGLVRLLEKRRSLKNLGKLVDALVRSAASPDENVRALLLRAAHQADVEEDLAAAKADALQATTFNDAHANDRASAWLALEVLAGRTGDSATRAAALTERTKFAVDPTWRGLLLVDRARTEAAGGQLEAAMGLLEEARSLGSKATWEATFLLEELTRQPVGARDGTLVRARAEVHADVLDEAAGLQELAEADETRGDALGVPRWARETPRIVDAWLRTAEARRELGQIDRAAATLDRAIAYLGAKKQPQARFQEAAVIHARIRLAEQTGDTELAARLAEKRLETEGDSGLVAALAMRVAEHAASQGDAERALAALSRAIRADAGCMPARALQLDLLADGKDPAAFAQQLESFADQLGTDEARGRAFLLASYVWAVQAKDTAGARAALSQAAMFGVPQWTTARVGRALASISDDMGWYEEATKRLLAAGCDDREVVSLCVELIRLRHARGDAEGEAKAMREMSAAPRGVWLGRVLEAFLRSPGGDRAAAVGDGERPTLPPDAEVDPSAAASASRERARVAVEELATLEKDPELAHGLFLLAAVRTLAAGDTSLARRQLRELADRDPSDLVVASMLADLDRQAGDHAAAARIAKAAAAASSEPEVRAALELEGALELWRDGDHRGALEGLEGAMTRAPDAARLLIGWAGRGVDADSVDGRRVAIERAAAGRAADVRVLALERFATEIGGGDPDAASASLDAIDGAAPGGIISTAAALARLAWSQGAANLPAAQDAIARIAACGPAAMTLATAELARLARDSGDRQEFARAAGRWFEAGGGLPAALEWLAATIALGVQRDEALPRLAVAAALSGNGREAMLASVSLLQWLVDAQAPAAFFVGESSPVRLANLEVSPPGCDPRRRAAALSELDGALGDDAATTALALAGWSAFAYGDVEGALRIFQAATSARPEDLASWEGLRTCAELAGNRHQRAMAAAELGARCDSSMRGATFWEEAGLLWMDLGEDERADEALEASFARDPKRPIAFDKLFRRVRARKDNDKLLGLIDRRLEVADDPQEIQKLFWEQARALRQKGDEDGALRSLEQVTMLEPDHVGALALLGEINIRRGRFEEAAGSLARLAMLDGAPAKNRVTAGVAACDLYEKKLDRYDKALEVLLSLHQAKLSTLPVRERLARAAARTGAWNEATSMLEELMSERADAPGRIEAARLAMTIHRDRLAHPQGAAAAIVRLLQESPTDGEALDMLLETEHPRVVRDRLLENARRALVDGLQKEPTNVPALIRLGKVARALSDEGLHRAALGVLVSLGAADARSEQWVQIAAKKSRPPQIAIGDSLLRRLLAPGDDGPVADLFVLLGPTLVEALGPTLQSCGVGRRDKVDPRSGLALRNEVAAWAGAFGVRQFDLYIGGSDPVGVQAISGQPPSIVLGAGVNAPMSPIARARIARELIATVRGSTVARVRDEITVAAIVVAACKLAQVPIEHPAYAVLAEMERLIGKAIARKTRKLLPDICREIVSRGADGRRWARRALASQDRVAAVAAGDPSVVLLDALGPLEQGNLAKAIAGNARAEELLRFVLSPEYLEIRRALGFDENERP